MGNGHFAVDCANRVNNKAMFVFQTVESEGAAKQFDSCNPLKQIETGHLNTNLRLNICVQPILQRLAIYCGLKGNSLRCANGDGCGVQRVSLCLSFALEITADINAAAHTTGTPTAFLLTEKESAHMPQKGST